MRSTFRTVRRRGIVAIWYELLLGGIQIGITGAGFNVMTRGHVEWEEAQTRLASSGFSMDVREIVRGTIPDAENFGATPALKGIAAVPEETQSESIQAKCYRLKEMTLIPAGLKGTREKPLPSVDFDKPRDWKFWRSWLTSPGKWDVPSGEPDDAKAVLTGLRSRDEALVKELVAAARRPRTGLVPSQAQRMKEMIERNDPMPEDSEKVFPFISLYHCLLLRVEACMATGDRSEVKDLLPVLFAFVRLTESETGLAGVLRGNSLERALMSVVLKGIAAHQMTAEDLAACQKFFAAQEIAPRLKMALNLETALAVRAFQTVLPRGLDRNPYGENPEESRSWIRRTPTENLIVTGNCAFLIRDFLNQARCLEETDWEGLFEAKDELFAQAKSTFEKKSSLNYFQNLRHSLALEHAISFPSIYDQLVHTELQGRMLTVACALERRRLEKQELPDMLAELPKRLLAEIPRDLDGKPLRYHPAPGGFVIWSVALNRKDDWQGAPPDGKLPERVREQADWQIRVP